MAGREMIKAPPRQHYFTTAARGPAGTLSELGAFRPFVSSPADAQKL
jgi:hypothetical protein